MDKDFDYFKYGLDQLTNRIQDIEKTYKKAKTGDHGAMYALECQYQNAERIFCDEYHNIRRWLYKQPQIIEKEDNEMAVLPTCESIEELLKLLFTNNPGVVHNLIIDSTRQRWFKETMDKLFLRSHEKSTSSDKQKGFDSDIFFKNALNNKQEREKNENENL